MKESETNSPTLKKRQREESSFHPDRFGSDELYEQMCKPAKLKKQCQKITEEIDKAFQAGFEEAKVAKVKQSESPRVEEFEESIKPDEIAYDTLSSNISDISDLCQEIHV